MATWDISYAGQYESIIRATCGSLDGFPSRASALTTLRQVTGADRLYTYDSGEGLLVYTSLRSLRRDSDGSYAVATLTRAVRS